MQAFFSKFCFLDLNVEFLMTHLTKRLPYEIYMQSIGIVIARIY